MDTVSRHRLSYHVRLFLLLLGMSWVLVACFVAFQYHRERQYRIGLLDDRLQLYNTFLIDALTDESIDFTSIMGKVPVPGDGIRVSVINLDGSLVFDNTLDSLPGESHLDRPEVRDALAAGHGYTLRRHSASTDNNYFYSATRGRDVIVRSAVPYSLSLQEILDADRSFLWFMLAVTVAISIAGYFATRRIGRTISRLNRFAAKAERGEPVYDVEPFPHDELGSISNHIIRLYARLQRTMSERDSEHRRALHEQAEKTRIKKQLTNNINHELKTPVASVKLCLETVLEHRDLDAGSHWHFIEQCHAQTTRLADLLDDVAAITRMDDGADNIAFAPVSIDDMMAEIEALEAPRLHKAGMILDIDMPAGLVVNGNRHYLTSVFRNLIDNAVAYSGGTTVTVALDDETDHSYTFSVTDDGTGIPDQHIERIFERFYRIDKGRSRSAGGTGLGLSIVRNAVQLHGGSIYAANVPGGGVRFVFTLAR